MVTSGVTDTTLSREGSNESESSPRDLASGDRMRLYRSKFSFDKVKYIEFTLQNRRIVLSTATHSMLNNVNGFFLSQSTLWQNIKLDLLSLE